MQRLHIQGRANGTTQHFHQSLNDDDQKFDFSQELSVTKILLNKFAKTEKMDFFARQQKSGSIEICQQLLLPPPAAKNVGNLVLEKLILVTDKLLKL